MKKLTDKTTLMRVLALSLLFLFAAHAFCFFNLTYSGPSVMINVSSGSEAQTAGGQYLQPFYWRVRGTVSSPLWVGILSALYLTGTAALVARLLGFDHPLALFALCGTLMLGPAVTSLCAASLHTADACFLAALLITAGVTCSLRVRRVAALPVGAVLVAASLALDSSCLSFGTALALIALAQDALHGKPGKDILLRGAMTAGALAAGAACFFAGYAFMLSHYGLDREAALQLPAGGSLPGAWFYPIRLLFAPLTAYPHVNVILRALLILLGIAALVLLVRRLAPRRTAVLCAIALLMPLAVNLPVYARSAPEQTRLAYCLLDVFLIMLLQNACAALSPAKPVQRAAAGAFGVLFLGSIVFSNQVYLKKNLEFQSTLSVMTRVLSRIEQTEGYMPGSTPVAIVGTLEDSVLSVPHEGFEHLAALDAAAGNYAASSQSENIWYTWQIMGYPLNFISTYDQSLLEQREDVQTMPAFPAAGCCRMVDGTLVVKLS